MLTDIKKKLLEVLFGVPCNGVPLSSIKGTTHVCMPDERVDFNTWATSMQVSSKVKGTEIKYYGDVNKMG